MKQLVQNFLLIFVLIFATSEVLGQRVISGKITNSDTGEPLIGVTVIVVGTTTGARSDANGDYKVQVPAGPQTLKYSYIGFTTVDLPVGDSDVMDLKMQTEVLSTDEVLIIGYGTIKKEDATGSIQAVSSEMFNRGAITSPQDLLAGKVAGVQITSGGDPGAGATIRIRGGSSLSASNDPLIVIDGVPVFNDGISGSRNPLNLLNPNDIETFTVLKDASATAIYGSRASNGVILITTKKGKLGKKISVSYAGQFSVGTVIETLDVLGADDYRALIEERFAESHPARGLVGDANTDWQSEIYQAAVGTDHNVSVAGGVGQVPYRVSLGYTYKDGVLKTDNFNRTTMAVNVSPQLLNNTLQINANFKGMLSNNQFANRGAIGSAAFFDPTQSVMQDGNPYDGYFTWTQANGDPITIAPANPLALLNMRDDRSQVARYITNVQLDYRMPFLTDLRANLNLGYDYSGGQGTVDVPANAPFAFSDGGRDEEYNQVQKNSLLDFYLNYQKELGDVNLDVMAGYSWQHFFREDYSVATNVAGTEELTPADTASREYYLVSLFGRANLNFYDRFLLTFTLRRDGTSRFAEENRWGLFPSAALAVKVIEDGAGSLSKLKVRLGYGITGQQDIGDDFYPYLARYQSSFPNARYQLGNQFFTTLRPNGYDANIKWEETTTYNVGIDFGFLDSRITGSLDVYQRDTRDLLNFIPVAAGTNLTNFLTTNVGDMTNRGLELALNFTAIENDKMTWEIGGNMTINRNEITKLTATEDSSYRGVFTGGISGGVGNQIQIHSVGFPASSFYVYEQVYDENNVPIEGLYVDRNGDGQISDDDRYRLENPAADVFFGFTTLFTYGKFNASLAGRAMAGNAMYNNILSNQAVYNNLYNSNGYIQNVHSSTSELDIAVPQYFSDHFIQDASFLKIDNVTVGYSLPDLIPGGNLNVSLTVQNPVMFTNYSGIDPEQFSGIDGNIYPRPRTFLLGVNANF